MLGPEGAYSISLSGGYEDDVDLGDCFTYTGEGGRALKGTKANPKNLRTAPQSKDQELTRGNLALSLNVTSRKPVRVIRGYKLNNEFAPEYGYRYDGKSFLKVPWPCGTLSNLYRHCRLVHGGKVLVLHGEGRVQSLQVRFEEVCGSGSSALDYRAIARSRGI